MQALNNTKQSASVIPTIFLHGFSGEKSGLRPFADLYSGKDAICINLPGFGGTAAPETGTSDDIREYCASVWTEIRKVVPDGRVNLVGHSHGTMVGYVLAVGHPDEVARLDLFCPVARPRLLPRLLIGVFHFLQLVKLPVGALVRLGAHPLFVSMVTRYSFRPEWSKEDRQRISQMRLREAQFYSPVMFDLMRQTLQFMKLMKDSYCTVPTQICYVSDENVAGSHDYEWYEAHTAVKKIKEITGGHLCVVAHPARVVELFGREEKEKV
jgi:pimeloyl-ACP methyl ester carboxylesterase